MKRFLLMTLLTIILLTPVSQAQELKRPHILGISHIALYVHNLDSSLAFYKDLLGFQEQFRLNKPTGEFSTVFIKVNDLQCIELFPEKEAGSGRLYQIALITDDSEAMRAYLASKGVKVPEKVGKGKIGNHNFTCIDPNGFVVEFVQYDPEGWTMKDSGLHMGNDRISNHIKHIGFVADSLNKSLEFYRDILGFKETWRGSKDGQTLSWVNLKTPDGTDYLELMLYKEEARPKARLGSMNHMSMEVDDMAKAVANLEARPARKGYPKKLEIATGINRKRQCNLFDPDGTRTEIMEPNTIDGTPTQSSTAPAAK
jgi:lactoylglutathione lyase